jgi:hypothetical protein
MPAIGQIRIDNATLETDDQGYHTLRFEQISFETPHGTTFLKDAQWAQWSRSKYNPDGLLGSMNGTCVHEQTVDAAGVVSINTSGRGEFRSQSYLHLRSLDTRDGKAHFRKAQSPR